MIRLLLKSLIATAVVAQTSAPQLLFRFRSGSDWAMLESDLASARPANGTDAELIAYLRARAAQRDYERSFFNGPGEDRVLGSRALILYGQCAGAWASDAHFYGALCNLEMGQTGNAVQTLTAMPVGSDASIYVDRIVWSNRLDFIVQNSYPAGPLRDEFLSLIKASGSAPFRGATVERIAGQLAAWCKSHGSG